MLLISILCAGGQGKKCTVVNEAVRLAQNFAVLEEVSLSEEADGGKRCDFD